MKTHRHLAGRAPAFMTAAMTLLMAAVTPVRRRLPGVVGFMCLVGSIAPANAATPVVPLVTVDHHWEHQWFVWLLRHPVYESVEVMSIDSAGDYFRVVWVFFTDAPPAARIYDSHESGRACRPRRDGFGAGGGRAPADLATSFAAVGRELSVRVDHPLER